MLNLIETLVRQKFKGWPAYEKATGLPQNHGKRRIVFYLDKLTALLKPLGLQIKLIKDDFPVTLAEKLSVTSPYMEEDLEGIIGYTITWYSNKFNPITEEDPIVIEKVNMAIEYAQKHAVSLFDAIVKVTNHFYKP